MAKNCFVNVADTSATKMEITVATPRGCTATLGGMTLTPKV